MELRNLKIKKVRTTQQLNDIQYLHKTIWGLVDLEVSPGHILLAVQKANGLVLCAYYKGKPIGFSFGFCGLKKNNQVYLHSHNIGVLKEFRNLGVGYKIRLKEQEYMLARGIDLISWTFDPLESRNANFNFGKLGCVCKQYVRDYYGPMPDQLNDKIPSDRLIVDWPLKSKKDSECMKASNQQQYSSQTHGSGALNQSRVDESGLLRPVDNKKKFDQLVKNGVNRVYIEIPSDYQTLRHKDMNLVMEWRLMVRHLQETCFSEGMFISGFIYAGGRSLYVFDRATK